MSFEQYLLKGFKESNKLTSLLFSSENLQNIANQLIYNVFLETNKRIKSPSLLKIGEHLRNIYVEYSKYNSSDLFNEIKRLNEICIARLLPYLISDTKEYFDNLIDLENPNGIFNLERPQNVSTIGTKNIKSNADILLGEDFYQKAKILRSQFN